MTIIFYLLLMLAVGRCTKNNNFETKTVGVGVSVELTCPRKSTGSLFWIRIVSGDFPEVLRKTFSLKSNERITATEERGLFGLHIKEAKPIDAAVYYCIQISQQNIIFLTQTDLRVKEPESTAVSPTDPVRPGDSVTLQCSILSDSENKTRPEEQNLCCFKAFNQSLNNTRGNGVEVHEKEPGGPSKKKCVYSFYKTCHCDVAACEDIISGNRSELNTTGTVSRTDDVFLLLPSVVSAISVIVIAILIHAIKRNKCDYCHNKAAVYLQGNVAKRNVKRNEDPWIHSTVVFTVMETGPGVYTAAKAF